jgi:hypothetical protein
MGFEEGTLARLRRYRGEADRSLELTREAEGAARLFSERLFDGFERVAALGHEAGFEAETARRIGGFTPRVSASPGAHGGGVRASRRRSGGDG